MDLGLTALGCFSCRHPAPPAGVFVSLGVQGLQEPKEGPNRPRFPLKASFKGGIHIDMESYHNMDIYQRIWIMDYWLVDLLEHLTEQCGADAVGQGLREHFMLLALYWGSPACDPEVAGKIRRAQHELPSQKHPADSTRPQTNMEPEKKPFKGNRSL